MKKRYSYLLMLIWGVCTLGACSDMNDLHDKYLKDGETIYLAKFDSLSLHPGNGRIMVEYWLSDPKAKKCLVEWNLGVKNATIDISTTAGEVPNVFYLNELEESTISFDFTTCTNEMDYRSLASNVTCSVYGDRYTSTLMNATVASAKYNEGTGELTFTWSSNYENVVAYSVKYTTTSSTNEVLRFPVTDDRKIILPDFPENGSFEYATIYMPSEIAIDEFSTNYSIYKVK